MCWPYGLIDALIPRLVDRYPWAELRRLMDMIRSGSSTKLVKPRSYGRRRRLRISRSTEREPWVPSGNRHTFPCWIQLGTPRLQRDQGDVGRHDEPARQRGAGLIDVEASRRRRARTGRFRRGDSLIGLCVFHLGTTKG